MIWFILLFSSTWLGFELIPLILNSNYSFSFRVLNGWLIGSLFSGYFSYILNFFNSVNWFSSLCCTTIELFLSYYLHKKKRFYNKFNISEIHSWTLFFMIFITGISLRYLSQIYSTFPSLVPHIFRPVLDEELSFISYAMNFRRTNLFFYEESRLSGFYYKGYSTPLLYTASLMSLGASYSDASIIICLLNIISLSFILLTVSYRYALWHLVPVFFFFFSSPSSFRLFFSDKNRMNIQNDLVHQLEPNHQTIAYQTFFCLLSCSKMASYTIALTQYAIYQRSGFLTLLIPNIPAQIGTFFAIFAENKSNWPKIWPIIIGIFTRFFPFNFSYFPLFREEAMRGTLFAAFKIWFDSFSVMPFALFFQSHFAQEFRIEIFTRLAGFCFVIFIREGNDRFINYTAAVALIGPTINILFSLAMKLAVNLKTSDEIKGCILYVHWAIFFTFIAGGFICGHRVLQAKDHFIGKNEIQLINFINNRKNNISHNAILFIKPYLLHPAILAKRKFILGDKRSLFLNGYKISKRFKIYKEVIKSNFSAPVLKKYNIHYVIDTSSDSFFTTESNIEKYVIYFNDDYKLLKF